MTVSRTLLSTVALCLVPFAPVQARQQHPPVRLLGVFDAATGDPVTGAEVVDLGTGARTTTSVSGAISLAFLQPGPTILQIRKVGYTSRMVTVAASPADTASVTLQLTPLGHALARVVTTGVRAPTGMLASFDQHRAEGFGHFLTGDELGAMQNHRMSDVLRRVPGLKLFNDPQDRAAWYVGTSRGFSSIQRNGPNGTCLAAIMLDGVLVYSGSDNQDPFDINRFKPEELAGLEYYGGSAPMPIGYNSTRAACGLVVLWTK